MTRILPLKKHYSYEQFLKLDNSPVEAPPRSYTLILDPDYPKLEFKIC